MNVLVQSILRIKQNIIVNNFEVSRCTTAQLIPELDPDFTLQPEHKIRLHPRTGSSKTIRRRTKVGILVDLQTGLTSNFFMSKSSLEKLKRLQHADLRHQLSGKKRRNKVSKHMLKKVRFCTGEPVAEVISTLFFLVQVVVFRLQETFNSLATDGACKQVHLSHVFFFSCSCSQFVCTTSHSALTLHAWLKAQA